MFGHLGVQVSRLECVSHKGTGKTTIVLELLEALTGSRPPYVDCLQCYESSELFTEILEGIGLENTGSVNMSKFLLLLTVHLSKAGSTYLVFDRAECLLRHLGAHQFSTLLRLGELVSISAIALTLEDPNKRFLRLHLTNSLRNLVHWRH